MMMIQEFVKKYPQTVVTGPVPVSELAEALKKAYGAAEVPAEEIPAHRKTMYLQNALAYGTDRKMELRSEELRLHVIRIPVTDRTRRYTEKDFVKWDESDALYLVYEEKTNYFYCCSSMLHLEIFLARGIPKKAKETENEFYQEYLAMMQRYFNNYAMDPAK